MPAPPNLTPEQIAKAAERKAAKLAKKKSLADGKSELSDEQKMEIERRRFLKRDWVSVGANEGSGKERVKIVTWNILAQTLVRRELFPGSDCLRWSDRKAMLLAELEYHSQADIICLQECDRVKEYSTSLPHHTPIKGSGPGKLHGLVIFYRTSKFFVRSTKLIHLDEEPLSHSRQEDDGARWRGGSRQTKNVGLIAALEEVDGNGRGIVIATTHLFWHPKYAYERVRQSIILLRNIRQFQADNECDSWPAIFAGDLNTQPSEATYQLLISPHNPLPQAMVDEITSSRIVHDSVTKISPSSELPQSSSSNAATGSNTPAAREDDEGEGEGEGGGEGEGELPDNNERSIANTRPPRDDDGILSVEELVSAMRDISPQKGAKSAYGNTDWSDGQTFGNRGGFEHIQGQGEVVGRGEPAYTCFTPLFRLTLDYLLLLPPAQNASETEIISVYAPPKIEELGEGLPRKGICASDHLAIGCELAW
ncbi:uncharacterized protein I303_101427 [Kwoniella dejecticola CBS 10117]|uniref:Endonuclease/exonuclease/phosphatase domain-containing protein n=1 Tax=Kwoniella dejecticola CBS 10117 TaxID=1296121 RepID=A0A1A6AHQ4_9TREE|nr:uncharacterized protein I303_01436 [Kwoniella dejecticola CBS 10117]OBR89607.1 hypothetical protein I303_01436 [Kwoniella dejecticola CBS 10117]